MIVVAVGPPRPWRNIAHLDKLPVGNVGRLETQIITNRGRHIETSAAIEVRFRLLILKHILVMIRPERTAIFPLGVTRPIPLANRDPAMLTDRLASLVTAPGMLLFKPWYDKRRFRFGLAVSYVVIGQRAVKRILPRNERYRYIIVARPRLGIIETTVAAGPIRVP